MGNEQHQGAPERGESYQIIALQNLIKNAFPPQRYEGEITPVDGESAPELDEEQTLYDALKGKDWTQVPDEVIGSNPDGVVLLSDEAFCAFLPAWLIRSLDLINGENEVRELIIYTLGGSGGEPPSGRIQRRLQALSSDQREAVRQVVVLFSIVERDPFIRAQAEKALNVLDSLPPSLVN